MKKIALLVVALALVVTGLAIAQGKPDFSGKWAPKVDPNAAPPAGGGGGRGGGMGGGPMTIKQTAAELVRETVRGENTVTSTFKLDGSESVNPAGQGQSKSTAKWDGAKLVIKTVSEGQNGPQETTATWSLSGDGKELTIVTTSARGDRTMVYTKQ
jgi:hypothetical protein